MKKLFYVFISNGGAVKFERSGEDYKLVHSRWYKPTVASRRRLYHAIHMCTYDENWAIVISEGHEQPIGYISLFRGK